MKEHISLNRSGWWPFLLVAVLGIVAISIVVLFTRPAVSTSPAQAEANQAQDFVFALDPSPTPPFTGIAFPDKLSSTLLEPILLVSSDSVAVDQTISLGLVLTNAPEGLSGFDVTVKVMDQEIAELLAAEFPHFELTLQTREPAQSQGLRLRAVDLRDAVPPGSSAVTLATLQLKGKKAGSTMILLTLNAIDDDRGLPLTPGITGSLLQVVSATQ